jgi:hypothetical protein
VAVHKPRHHDAAARIEEGGLSRQGEIFQAAAGTDVVNAAVDDEDGAIWNQTEVSEIGAATGAAGSAQCEELPGTADQGGPRHPMGNETRSSYTSPPF